MADPIIFQGSIPIQDPDKLFRKHNVTQEQLARYRRLIREGKDDEAIEIFLEENLLTVADLYVATMVSFLVVGIEGAIQRQERNKMLSNVLTVTDSATSTMESNVELMVTAALGPVVFKRSGMVGAETKKLILETTMDAFNDRIRGAMAQTEANVLELIRTMQREMIKQNQFTSRLPDFEGLVRTENIKFRRALRRKFPGYFKAMENGDILKSRIFGVPPTVKRFKLEQYLQMATRTTLLNVERDTEETMAKITSHPFVEYFQRDTRTIKTSRREICKQILNKKILGKSLLAMDQSTAKKLGVLTVTEARQTLDKAMGVFCTHGIKRTSDEFVKLVTEQFGLQSTTDRARAENEREKEKAA